MVKRSNHTTNDGMYDSVTLVLKSVKKPVLLRITRSKVDPSPTVEPGKVGPRDYRVATVKLCGNLSDCQQVDQCKWANGTCAVGKKYLDEVGQIQILFYSWCQKEEQHQPRSVDNFVQHNF